MIVWIFPVVSSVPQFRCADIFLSVSQYVAENYHFLSSRANYLGKIVNIWIAYQSMDIYYHTLIQL